MVSRASVLAHHMTGHVGVTQSPALVATRLLTKVRLQRKLKQLLRQGNDGQHPPHPGRWRGLQRMRPDVSYAVVGHRAVANGWTPVRVRLCRCGLVMSVV